MLEACRPSQARSLTSKPDRSRGSRRRGRHLRLAFFGNKRDACSTYGNDSTCRCIFFVSRSPDLERSLPRQRAPGILLSLGWSHPGAFNRVAGKTRRFSRNRCVRKRIGQFPAFDAYLLNNLWHPMSGADRIRFAGDLARSQRRLCHHRLHPRERRKFLSLSAHDPFSELENCVLVDARVNAFESCPAPRRRLPRRELLNRRVATLDRTLPAGRRSRFRKSQLREANSIGVAQSISR